MSKRAHKKNLATLDAQMQAQALRLAKKESHKLMYPSTKQVVEDMDKIARDLQDIKTVLCCIAYQQEDHSLQIPFEDLGALPKGIELEIKVDREMGCYSFTCILPPAPKDATLAT